MAVLPSNYRHIYESFLPDEAGPQNQRDGCGAKYSCAPTSLGSRATPPRYVMEELSLLLVIQSQQLAAGFRPVRSASEVTVAWLNVEQSATEAFDQQIIQNFGRWSRQLASKPLHQMRMQSQLQSCRQQNKKSSIASRFQPQSSSPVARKLAAGQ